MPREDSLTLAVCTMQLLLVLYVGQSSAVVLAPQLSAGPTQNHTCMPSTVLCAGETRANALASIGWHPHAHDTGGWRVMGWTPSLGQDRTAGSRGTTPNAIRAPARHAGTLSEDERELEELEYLRGAGEVDAQEQSTTHDAKHGPVGDNASQDVVRAHEHEDSAVRHHQICTAEHLAHEWLCSMEQALLPRASVPW
jgi:hypothetical protein